MSEMVTLDLLEFALRKKQEFDLPGAKDTAHERKGALLAYLIENHVGKENAIRAVELQYLFGDSTDRPTTVIDGYISGFGCALRDVDLVINERKYRRKALFVLVIALLLLALLIGMAY
jgi:hypothetical protein